MKKEEMCFIVTTYVIVLDFSKAFDVVPQHRLLHKLDHYGFRGTTLNCMHNLLTNRTQKVVVFSPCEVRCAPGYFSRTLTFLSTVY